MKILHTSDWHLGKRLHQVDLNEDHRLFTDWLIKTIDSESIDALLISGDVFDLANPSSEARKLYYETLVRLSRLNCQVIITGGNHDSPAVLNAPKEILKSLNIHVIGGLTEKTEEMLIPLTDKQNNTQLVVAAIPFLRDADLRHTAGDESYEDRTEAVRAGITRVFDKAAEACRNEYPNLPCIAMGHLFTSGASISDSERDIQVGGQAQYNAAQLNDYFERIALGHIHKPQKAGNTDKILYSGSPIPLSFSEKSDHKRVLIYDFSKNPVAATSLHVPVFRKLIKITGSFSEIHQKLEQVTEKETPLQTLIEIEMQEEKEDPQKITDLENLIADFQNENFQVVKHRVSFKNMVTGTHQLYNSDVNIEELQPGEVFNKRLERSDLDEQQKQLLREAFQEILDSIQQQV